MLITIIWTESLDGCKRKMRQYFGFHIESLRMNTLVLFSFEHFPWQPTPQVFDGIRYN